MKKSDAVNELAAALAKAQGAMKPAAKNKKNPYFDSTYADLDSCWEAARVPLSQNGLAVVQWPEVEGKRVKIITLLLHSSGQWIESELMLEARDGSVQAIGGTITYGRRYAFCCAVGITSDEDDDGNQSMAAPKTAPAAKPAPKPRIVEKDGVPEIYAATKQHRQMLRTIAQQRAGIVDDPTLLRIETEFLREQVQVSSMAAGVDDFVRLDKQAKANGMGKP